jgi:hypothetical protein
LSCLRSVGVFSADILAEASIAIDGEGEVEGELTFKAANYACFHEGLLVSTQAFPTGQVNSLSEQGSICERKIHYSRNANFSY